MARPKQYKYEAVLEKAMDLFWAKGYNGTSIQDLVDHLKLSKASMYEAFDDKHGLFIPNSALGKTDCILCHYF